MILLINIVCEHLMIDLCALEGCTSIVYIDIQTLDMCDAYVSVCKTCYF